MRAVACASAQPAARVVKVSNGARRTMMRPGIHPEFFEEAPVYCNGEQVLTVGGTKKEYYVELWSGNHPFYQGVTSAIVVDEGAVNKFKKRYAGLDSLSKVSTVSETIKAKKEQ